MRRILIIENDPRQRKVIDDFLRKEKFDTLQAADGQEGVRLIREVAGEFEAIFLAATLPGLPGLDTLIGIRKFNSSVPVIMIMDEPGKEVMLQALRRGATDFVYRPIKVEEVLVALRNAVERNRLYKHIDRQIQRLRILEKSTGELTAANPEDEVPEELIRDDFFLRKMLELIAAVLEVKKVSLMLLDREKGELVMAQSNWMDPKLMGTIRTPLGKGVAGWVAKEGKPILVTDVAKDKRLKTASYTVQYENPSFICTPLFFHKKVVGTISANDRADGEALTEADLTILNTFSNQVSLAIGNLFLNRKIQREHLKLTFLLEIVNSLIASIDPGDICRALVDKVRTTLKAGAAAMTTLSGSGEGLVWDAVSCNGKPPPSKDPFDPGEGVLGRVLSTGKTQTGEAGMAPPDLPCGIRGRSILAVPLKIKGKTLGALLAFNREDGQPFDAWDRELLESSAPAASMALKNIWLYQNLMETVEDVVATNRRLDEANREIQEKVRELDNLRKKVTG